MLPWLGWFAGTRSRPLGAGRPARRQECQALSPLYAEGLGVRIVSEFGWVIGQVPAA